MEILRTENLSFAYPEAELNALDGISLKVKSGEFILLCGESGCGKTTLIKLLKKEIAPFGKRTGEIYCFGENQNNADPLTLAADIGYVTQNPEHQIVTDTVWQELAFGLENLGLSGQVIRRRVAEMASYFGIGHLFDKKTFELSGGQKQLLNLAAVMVMQPKILLLDEPTAQLDPIAAADFISTLQKINHELGLTVILTEHRLEEVFPIADRVWVMEKGKIIIDAPPRKVGDILKSRDPNHPMMGALPSGVRIFEALDVKADCPLTVKEGRAFVTSNFKNEICSLPILPTDENAEKVLTAKNLRFKYDRNLPDVLKDCSLTLFKGETLSILGGNGVGKSTLLKVLGGLQKPYMGRVKVFGKDIGKATEKDLYKKGIAILPQDPTTLFLHKNVKEDLTYILDSMDILGDDCENQINQVAEKLGISHLLDRHPYDLSGGEQQKAALAMVLLRQPKILLMDEPTKGIDALSKNTMAKIISRLKKDGLTLLMVTHDVEFAAVNSNRCALFFGGEIVSVSSPVEFFENNNFYTTAANRMVRGYYKNAVSVDDVITLCKRNKG